MSYGKDVNLCCCLPAEAGALPGADGWLAICCVYCVQPDSAVLAASSSLAPTQPSTDQYEQYNVLVVPVYEDPSRHLHHRYLYVAIAKNTPLLLGSARYSLARTLCSVDPIR